MFAKWFRDKTLKANFLGQDDTPAVPKPEPEIAPIEPQQGDWLAALRARDDAEKQSTSLSSGKATGGFGSNGVSTEDLPEELKDMNKLAKMVTFPPFWSTEPMSVIRERWLKRKAKNNADINSKLRQARRNTQKQATTTKERAFGQGIKDFGE